MRDIETILDPVIGRFDYEKPYSEKKDYPMKNLSGIPIQFLNGIDREDAIELVDVIIGNDLKGFDGLGSPVEQNEALFRYLVKTRNLIANNPDLVKGYQNPEQAMRMFNYAIRYWNTDKRDEALQRLVQTEQKLILRGEILTGPDYDPE